MRHYGARIAPLIRSVLPAIVGNFSASFVGETTSIPLPSKTGYARRDTVVPVLFIAAGLLLASLL
jgi:hypothetical protein